MSKKRQRVAVAAVAIAGPTPERAQHNRITLADDTILDERGEISRPYRVHSMLDRLVRRGVVSDRERQAGEQFQQLYRTAALHPLRAADLLQEIHHQAAHLPHGSDRARLLRDDAMDALGGHSSPCGCCAWFVLGEELTLREWALREGWSGRPLREEVAKGILLGALGVLAEHFGL